MKKNAFYGIILVVKGRSQKKAYELFDSPVYDQIEVGTTKGMYPWVGGSVLGLSVGYSPNQLTSRQATAIVLS